MSLGDNGSEAILVQKSKYQNASTVPEEPNINLPEKVKELKEEDSNNKPPLLLDYLKRLRSFNADSHKELQLDSSEVHGKRLNSTNCTGTLQRKSKTVKGQRKYEDSKIGSRLKSRNKLSTPNQDTNISKPNNWIYLKEYLNVNFDQTQNLIIKLYEEGLTSKPNRRMHNFPYHSYLKHRKNKLAVIDPYIVTTETKKYNKRHKISSDISNNPKNSRLIKTVLSGNNKELRIWYKESLEDTTAKILENKYSSLYEKLQQECIPTKQLKHTSPFHDYLTKQRKKRVIIVKKEKTNKIPTNVREHKEEDTKEKIYIGQEIFPLSIYERSMY